MHINHIFFIINPASGKDEPVTEMISEVFRDSPLEITVHVLDKHDDPAAIARKAAATAGLVAVYGGDGSITTAAAGLIGTDTPLAIIPGGTANVLSKELGIPQDTTEALQLLRDGRWQPKVMDTGTVNGTPFLLRINLGIMAEMITGADPSLKEKIGQLAYSVSTIKSVSAAEPVNYELNIDGQEHHVSGVSLTVTNSGSMGIGQLQLWPGISITDGLLDVVLLKDADFITILKAAGTLAGIESDAVSHWACKEIIITLPAEQTYLCDDCEAKNNQLAIKVVPASLTVAAPLTQ